jgi:hypothetical protein
VSCPTATSCYAFGYKNVGANSKTVVEHWDGASWSIMPTPNSAQPVTFIFGGTCVSDTSCFAVGNAVNFNASPFVERPFVMAWDGSAWTTVPSAALPGTSSSSLASVACTSATNCVAVGSLSLNGVGKTLVERWNGTTWAHVASPNPAGASGTAFHGVACPSANRCFGVGSTYNGTSRALIETFDGTKWTITATPAAGPNEEVSFAAVTCTNTTHCYAVGHREYANEQTFVWRLVGLKWVALATPRTTGDNGRVFNDMTCADLTHCYAVGFSDEFISTTSHTLIEHWNGQQWTIRHPPNVGSTSNVLNGVACISATSCFAVGYGPNDGPDSLILHWNGTVWSLSPHPQPTP